MIKLKLPAPLCIWVNVWLPRLSHLLFEVSFPARGGGVSYLLENPFSVTGLQSNPISDRAGSRGSALSRVVKLAPPLTHAFLDNKEHVCWWVRFAVILDFCQLSPVMVYVDQFRLTYWSWLNYLLIIHSNTHKHLLCSDVINSIDLFFFNLLKTFTALDRITLYILSYFNYTLHTLFIAYYYINIILYILFIAHST